MFKKFILSLPFVKHEIDTQKNIANICSAVSVSYSKDAKNALEEKESVERKYQQALNDLSAKNIQVYDLTKLLDVIVDYFVPEKQQPMPLEYKDIPALIIKTCSQQKKSKKPKKSVKKTKQSTSSLVSGLLRK
jgi:hypothetical protein